jgi:hypothetical protein
MRILIANDTDDSVCLKKDVRSWTQRIVWFAKENDIIIFSDPPCSKYVELVCKLKDIDSSSLRIITLKSGRFGNEQMDTFNLLDEELINGISEFSVHITEIIPLWPSPNVSDFAERLGLSDRFKGCGFFSQFGVELGNNKCNFRAISIGNNISIPDGKVCHSKFEAIVRTRRLLEKYGTVIIKRAHGGAGAGNYILTLDHEVDTGHSGAKYFSFIGNLDSELFDFWHGHWEWASFDNAYGVVIEEYIPNAQTIYVEFLCSEQKVNLEGCGELLYEKGSLVGEFVNVLSAPEHIKSSLFSEGEKLASVYQKLGYRGLISCDAIHDGNNMYFTEVNARFSGSTHLYSIIANDIVCDSTRFVAQVTSPDSVFIPSVEEFVYRLSASGLLFDPEVNTGVYPVTPTFEKSGQIIYFVVANSFQEFGSVRTIVNELFK